MSSSTNVRLSPGVYLTLKYLSEQTGISIGDINTFFFMLTWAQLKLTLPQDLTSALTADFARSLAETIKFLGMKGLNPNIAQLYKELLNPSKTSSIV